MIDVSLTGRLTKMCAYDAAQDIVNQLAGHEYGTALSIVDKAYRMLKDNLVVQPITPIPQIREVKTGYEEKLATDGLLKKAES